MSPTVIIIETIVSSVPFACAPCEKISLAKVLEDLQHTHTHMHTHHIGKGNRAFSRWAESGNNSNPILVYKCIFCYWETSKSSQILTHCALADSADQANCPDKWAKITHWRVIWTGKGPRGRAPDRNRGGRMRQKRNENMLSLRNTRTRTHHLSIFAGNTYFGQAQAPTHSNQDQRKVNEGR